MQGLANALSFVVSLFGSFWALTEVWRGYFFDSRNIPIIVTVSSLALMAGCRGTVTFRSARCYASTMNETWRLHDLRAWDQ